MSKVIQVKISRTDVENGIKSYINKRITEVCRKTGVDQQIAFEINEAVVEVLSMDYEERIKILEEKIRVLEAKLK